MVNYSQVKEELKVLIWLIRSGKSGSEVLDFATEIVYSCVSMCFVVLDKERVLKMIRTEVIGLLYDVARGKIKMDNSVKFSSYLLNRYLRLVRNLLKEGSIKGNNDLYVDTVSCEKENIIPLDIVAYRSKTTEPILLNNKEKNNGYTQKKTTKKEIFLRTLAIFKPEVAKEVKIMQKSLF